MLKGSKIQKESRSVCACMDAKVHVSTCDTGLEIWQERETILALQLCAIDSLGQKKILSLLVVGLYLLPVPKPFSKMLPDSRRILKKRSGS